MSDQSKKTTKKQYALHLKRWLAPIAVAEAFVISVLIGSLAMLYFRPSAQPVDKNGYQAVFLLNDQAYFGKLTITPGGYVLKNPYVIQNAAKPTDEKVSGDPNTFNLRKVTDTLYGPKDSMEINRDQVVLWQNLDPNSKVVKAIESASQ